MLGERAFSFSGPCVWNAVRADVRGATSTATFKKKLKTFYFSLAFVVFDGFFMSALSHTI